MPGYSFRSWGTVRILLDSRRVRIASGVRIGARATIEVLGDGELSIGEGTSIGADLVLACAKRVEIGRKVLFASRCFISDTYHRYDDIKIPIIDQGAAEGRLVCIEDECWIGINVCILPGVTIGRHTVVGANSVVTRDLPPFVVACGSPARVIRRYDPSTGEWVSTRDPAAIAVHPSG